MRKPTGIAMVIQLEKYSDIVDLVISRWRLRGLLGCFC